MNEKNTEKVPITFRIPLWVKKKIKKSSIRGNRTLSREAESLLLTGFNQIYKEKT